MLGCKKGWAKQTGADCQPLYSPVSVVSSISMNAVQLKGISHLKVKHAHLQAHKRNCEKHACHEDEKVQQCLKLDSTTTLHRLPSLGHPEPSLDKGIKGSEDYPLNATHCVRLRQDCSDLQKLLAFAPME